MVNRFVVFLFVISPMCLLAQRETVVKTDSSTIETKYFEDLNSIRVFNNLKTQNKSYFTDYYYDTKRVKERGVFLGNNSHGVWKEFWPDGKLKSVINHTAGVITYFDKKAYPFYDYQLSIKLKGDSIIRKIYSNEFLKKNVVWDIDHSYIYHHPYSGNWTDSLELKPEEFLLRYAIKLDGKIYPEIIELHLDKHGRFVADQDIKGLEKLPANTKRTFKLTLSNAILLAKQKGLVESRSKKADAFLTWESEESKSIYRGHFRVYVIINTTSLKDIHPKGRSTIIDKYDVYIFNPWSGTFIQKKKMKAIRGWEEGSGSSTGLLPDR